MKIPSENGLEEITADSLISMSNKESETPTIS